MKSSGLIKGVGMGVIKNVVRILAYTFLVMALAAAWFALFALGYFLQGTWACIPCMAANFAIGIVLARITLGEGGRYEDTDTD